MKKGSYLYYALANGMFYYAWGTFACIISVYLAGIGFIATDISLITSASTPILQYSSNRFVVY